MRRRYVSLLVVMLVALLMLAACASDFARATSSSGTATTTAKTAACNGLATVNQALASLSSINVDTTVGDVHTAQQKVTNALSAIQSRIPSDSGTTLSQIKEANDQLAAKIQGYPDETPIGQTSAKIQDLKATVASVQSKTTHLASALKCTP
ncbi:MAG TPA: hypothetical protein VF916_15870 [Ktedonobacterales bacterium]